MHHCGWHSCLNDTSRVKKIEKIMIITRLWFLFHFTHFAVTSQAAHMHIIFNAGGLGLLLVPVRNSPLSPGYWFPSLTHPQLYGKRAAWEDPSKWVNDTYPWNAASLQQEGQSLLQLRPEDVGYDGYSSSKEGASSKQVSQSDTEGDPLVRKTYAKQF